MAVEIQASLHPQTFTVGEQIPLVLTVSNSGPEVVRIADPRAGGNHFRFRVQVAGETHLVTMAQATASPGVPSILSLLQVPVSDQWVFDFDIAQLAGLHQVGNYTLTVEYEWQPGETWHSLPMLFQIAQSPEGSLLVTANESFRAGYHGLLWLQPKGTEARALLLDFRIQKPRPPVTGAIEIARLPPASRFTLSMSPAGDPFLDRWLVWVAGEALFYSFWARSFDGRLPPKSLSFRGYRPELISPALAGAPPAEGRPDCVVGLLVRSSAGALADLALVSIDSLGQAYPLQRQTIYGDVRGAWASSPSRDLRLFVFAVQTGPTLQILCVSQSRGEGQPPVSWFKIEAEFLAGDVRPALDRKMMVGLLVKREGKWERLAFTAGGSQPDAKATPLEGGREATPVRIRLDASGGVHTLFLREEILRYAPPSSNAEAWSNQRPVTAGNSADLLIDPYDRAVLVYYDFEKGPTFLRV